MTEQCKCGIARVDCEYHRADQAAPGDQCVSAPMHGWVDKGCGVLPDGKVWCGTVLRRPDGEYRLVHHVDYTKNEYSTERCGLHPYALVPPGWREVPSKFVAMATVAPIGLDDPEVSTDMIWSTETGGVVSVAVPLGWEPPTD